MIIRVLFKANMFSLFSDVLKIFFALKKEPLTIDEINAIIEEKRRSEEFWKNFKS